MRLGIVGSRSITSEIVKEVISKFLDENGIRMENLTVLSGGAKGVDTIAREFCKELKIDYVLFKPYHLLDNQAAYIPRYYFIRNKQIADNSDAVLIIWDGISHGTGHMINYCTKKGKKHIVIKYNKETPEGGE